MPETPTNGELRLAVAGLVARDAGSVSSAHHALLAAMLQRGHRIDFFANPRHVPDPGFDHQSFRYVAVDASSGRFVEWLSTRRLGVLSTAAAKLTGLAYERRLVRRLSARAAAEHGDQRYDASLTLGVGPWLLINGCPAFAWPQSGPLLERDGLREASVGRSRTRYAAALLWYEVRGLRPARWWREVDVIVASTESRRRAVAAGAAPDRVHLVPYAVEAPSPTLDRGDADPGPRQIVCLGRLDPRKRVDLLAAAARDPRLTGKGIEIVVYGRDGYLPGQVDAVSDAARGGAPIAYGGPLPRSEALETVRRAALLVQPSSHEEFGHSVAEAVRLGVPVVIRDTNGTGDWIDAPVATRFEAPTGEALATAILRGLAFASRADAAARCREAGARFEPDRVAPDIEAAIKRGIARVGRRATG